LGQLAFTSGQSYSNITRTVNFEILNIYVIYSFPEKTAAVNKVYCAVSCAVSSAVLCAVSCAVYIKEIKQRFEIVAHK
jgi:hypothetical protein